MHQRSVAELVQRHIDTRLVLPWHCGRAHHGSVALHPAPARPDLLWRPVLLIFLLTVLTSGCAMLESADQASPSAAQTAEIQTDEIASPQTIPPVVSKSAPVDPTDPAAQQFAADRSASAANGSTDNGQSPEHGAEPTGLVSAATTVPESIWTRLESQFTFPDCSADAHALIWESWYQHHPDYLQRVFNRARPWLYLIMEQVEARGLPAEFVLLPVIESAFDVFALSPAGAHGPWQMTRPTAQDYGLEMHSRFDARRDMVMATEAALTMLDRLMTQFDGNWRLALAAYNAGPTRVARAVQRGKGPVREMDPAYLSLPRETKTYAPKLHGLVCLLRQSDHGLTLPYIEDRPVIGSISLQAPADLIEVAHRADVDITALYTLNAGLNSNLTPASQYELKLPLAHIQTYTNAPQSPNTVTRSTAPPLQRIFVKPGDTLGAIAKRHTLSVQQLKQFNDLRSNLIRPGQALYVQQPDQAMVNTGIPGYAKQLAELRQLQNSLPGVGSSRHRISRNETLSTIARRYHVSVAQLQSWNTITNPHRIRVGQTLLIYNQQQPLAARTDEYQVRRGDSLWRIARQFRVSIEDLLTWNKLSKRSVLRPGQRLRLSP